MNRLFRLTRSITIGIARDQAQRRRAMFALMLAALAMLFAGIFLLWSTFAIHPLFFAIYWLVCVWLVICVLLLAIYDLLSVVRQGRKEHAEAHKEIFRDID